MCGEAASAACKKVACLQCYEAADARPDESVRTGCGARWGCAMTMRQKLIDVLDRGPVAVGFLLRQEWAGRETGTFVWTRVPFGTPAPVGLR